MFLLSLILTFYIQFNDLYDNINSPGDEKEVGGINYEKTLF